MDDVNDNLDNYNPYEARLSGQWLSTVALRETLGIALKRTEPPTYEQVFTVADKLAKEILGRDVLLFNTQESKTAKKYRQKASLLSARAKKIINPLTILEEDIDNTRNLLQNNTSVSDTYLVNNELHELLAAKKEILQVIKSPQEEMDVLLKDWKRGIDLPNNITSIDNYHDFVLPNRKIMRIRFLHPVEAERITGVDLFYEHHDPDNERARISAIQYKMWNGKSLRIDSIQDQLDRMSSTFCNRQMCMNSQGNTGEYRLPCCTAFLRPTDKLQQFEPRLASSGHHVPLCEIEKLKTSSRKGYDQITLENIQNQSISYKIFEELFNKGKLGSRWLSYQELEQFHNHNKILKSYQQTAIHVQEVPMERRRREPTLF